jgi:kynurenine formamidase
VNGRTDADSDVIDLTMRLTDDTPVYPGDPAVRISVAADFADAGFFNTRLSLGSHNGTHIDAEGHMVPGGRMLHDYPLDRFHGRGVLLDVRTGSPALDLDAAEAADIDSGCIVLLRTGLSDAHYEAGYYAAVPDLTTDLVDLLIARGVKMVGIDAGSIDDEPFAIHKALLSHGILIAENLVGLTALASRAGAGFDVWALPLNLEVEASPARVVAVCPRQA